MNRRTRFSTAAICSLMLLSITSFAQTVERPQTNPAQRPQEQAPAVSPAPATADPVANELGLLRKSLQALNARLREIGDKLLAPEVKTADTPNASNDRRSRLSLNLELLSRAEQRAEAMRRQLLELTEKETWFKNRLVQIDEDARPDSIDRSLSLVGSTRTPELRDVRRRVLDNERRGVESLLNQTAQSRLRLEDDVKQADALVARLRQRLLPLIEKEIDKINPDEK